MAHSTPTVQHGALNVASSPSSARIIIDTPDWYVWLASAASFYYSCEAGTFTARKERRARGGEYWTAYRTCSRRLFRAYLGKTECLNSDHLEDVARSLAMRAHTEAHTPEEELREGVSSRKHVSRRLRQVPSDSHAPAQTSLALHDKSEPPFWMSADMPLATKTTLPPLRPGLLTRVQLNARLEEHKQSRLIVLSAPVGFGKTTLLRQWCAETGWPTAWISLDEGENDPFRFLRYVSVALTEACPGAGTEALELLHVLPSPPVESVLTSLVNSLANRQDEIILVLDDFHAITVPATHAALTFLLKHAPPNLHVVVATRAELPLSLARLRARHQLYEIQASDLRFTAEEVGRYFTQVMGMQLSNDIVTSLELCTEGWIAALQLAALALQGQTDVSGVVKTFARGSHRSLVDLLVEEVLCQQPDEIQHFLVQTAFLDRLSGPLCEAILNDAAGALSLARAVNGQATLEQLERANLFLIPLDSERRWYRYHHLFAEFLRERLRRTHSGQVAMLHRRAAQWYAEHNLPNLAIPHMLAAGEVELAAHLIIEIGASLMKRGEVKTVLQWLDVLPGNLVRSSPRLCLLYAESLLMSGRFEAADPWLREAEIVVNDRHTGHLVEHMPEITRVPRAAAAVAALAAPPARAHVHEAVSILGEVAALRAHSAAYWGNAAETIARAHQALEWLPADHSFLRGLSALNLGIACWLQGDLATADHALNEARILGQTAENTYVVLEATCALAQVQIVQGRRRLAFQTSQQALRLATQGSGRLLPAAAYAFVGMGQILYEWNEMDAATRYLRKAISVSERWNSGDMLVYSYTVLAQVKQAQGDLPGAREMVERAEHCAQRYPQQPWIVAVMVAQQIRLALMQGRLDAVDRWVQATRDGYVAAFEQVTMARIHLAHDRPEQALEIAEQRLSSAERARHRGTTIELNILRALAYQQQQDSIRAMRSVARALSLAEPEGYIRLFLDEGLPMARLLAQMLPTHPSSPCPSECHIWRSHTAYIRKLLALFERPEDTAADAANKGKLGSLDAVGEQLTSREQEILHALSVGQSNEDIARDLVIEVSTVKWHLTRIYEKLNVHTRTQAVIRAKDLRLI